MTGDPAEAPRLEDVLWGLASSSTPRREPIVAGDVIKEPAAGSIAACAAIDVTGTINPAPAAAASGGPRPASFHQGQCAVPPFAPPFAPPIGPSPEAEPLAPKMPMASRDPRLGVPSSRLLVPPCRATASSRPSRPARRAPCKTGAVPARRAGCIPAPRRRPTGGATKGPTGGGARVASWRRARHEGRWTGVPRGQGRVVRSRGARGAGERGARGGRGGRGALWADRTHYRALAGKPAGAAVVAARPARGSGEDQGRRSRDTIRGGDRGRGSGETVAGEDRGRGSGETIRGGRSEQTIAGEDAGAM